MFELIAAFIVFVLVILGMSIRFLVSGRHLKRSCGSMTNMKKLIGYTPCARCTQNTSDCKLRLPPSAD